MNLPLTIVAYHYVRDPGSSRYPAIKGRSLDEFVGQLEYLQRHYHFTTMADCVAAVYEGRPLPKGAALLTFDDGYVDHFTNVLPQLEARGIQGCFFPPAKAVLERRVLDVNKIHFILAATPSVDDLMRRVSSLIDEFRDEYEIESMEVYFERLAVASRWDAREVRFLKNLLQYGLPREPRRRILAMLFRKYVTEDEESFAHELYMTVEQLRCLRTRGMHVGSHAYDHLPLDILSPEERHEELERSMGFLGSLGVPKDELTLCYPHGAYDQPTMEIVRKAGFRLAFSTRVGLARLTDAHAFCMERLDTNDLPVEPGAPPNEWTRSATG